MALIWSITITSIAAQYEESKTRFPLSPWGRGKKEKAPVETGADDVRE
jgi:hypothetical protein